MIMFILIKKRIFEWACKQVIEIAKRRYQNHVIFGINIYTPHRYHEAITATIAILKEIDEDAAKLVLKQIKYIIAFDVNVRYGFVKNCTVIMDYHCENLPVEGSESAWPWLAGRLVAGAMLSSHFAAKKWCVLDPKSQLAIESNRRGADIIEKLNLVLKITPSQVA